MTEDVSRFVEDGIDPAFVTLTGPDGAAIEIDPPESETVA